MGAKPKQTRSAARTSGARRTPARRVPARKAASKSMKAGAAAGRTVDAYLAGLEGWQREAAERLREVIRSAAPSLEEVFKWGQPVYQDGGPVCYFRSNTDHITFGFWRGAEMDDPEQRLEGDGGRMKHLKLASGDDISEEALAAFVRQGVELNQRLGDPTRRSDEPAAPELMAAGAGDLEAVPVVVPETPAAPAPQPSQAMQAADDDGWHEYQP